jgi:hypothetical protein
MRICDRAEAVTILNDRQWMRPRTYKAVFEFESGWPEWGPPDLIRAMLTVIILTHAAARALGPPIAIPCAEIFALWTAPYR